jgi:hypothetical protein
MVGELLPRGEAAVGVHDKLATYSLDMTNEIGRHKARGFELILGVTIEDIDYLKDAIQTGILAVPVSAVRANLPWGVNCVVMVPVRGLGEKRERVVNVRTVWELVSIETPPRLVNAYLKP